ncbi:MAG: hypothetical protein EBU90_27045 [Proteobacteria bacterium]|nr:hypothetical protein [Pseudomonadota bacterium]
MMQQGEALHDSISKLLVERLLRRKGEKLTSQACSEIYQDIFFSLSEVVKESSIPLSNESVNFIAQMYYDSVTINGGQELDPNIFTQRANLSNINTKELALMAMMFNKTPFAIPFIQEVKKRS